MNYVRDAADKVLMGTETAGQAEGCAKREPEWHELGIEEKLERIRTALQTIAQQQMVIGRIANDANNLVHTHEHVQGRGLMKPVRQDFVNYAGALGEMGFSTRPMENVLARLR